MPDLIKSLPLNSAPKITIKPEPKFPSQQAIQAADQVTLSAQAKELQALAPKIQAVPEVRPSRVEQVRQKLTNVSNDVEINAKLAEKLLTGN